MANREITQLRGSLTALPGTAVASGDTVTNSTNGTLTLAITTEATVGDGKIRSVKDGSDLIKVLPGATSAAITLAEGELVYVLNVNGSLGSTADKIEGQ